MDQFRNKSGYICDMDGVIYHGNRLLPGAKEFVEWLYREKKKFLFLTNNSGKTPRELQDKLARMGLEVDEQHFYTSALATAEFIAAQMPGAKAYVIGEPGLYNALYDRGITLSDINPDYVVMGSPPTTTTTPSARRSIWCRRGPGSSAATPISPVQPRRGWSPPAGPWWPPLRWPPARRPISLESPTP